MEAALQGAKEIGFTVLSISLSLVAVFIPILLMGGIVGRLFREFAVTLSVAILVSLVISLTTTPMMCALLLKHDRPEDHGRLYRASETFFSWMLRTYEKSLGWVLRHQALHAGRAADHHWRQHLFVCHRAQGLFPAAGQRNHHGRNSRRAGYFVPVDGNRCPSYSSIESSPIRRSQNVMGYTGGNGAVNGGFVYIGLKPLNERKISASQVINRLRPKLTSTPGATVFLQAGQDLRIGGRQSNAQYQYTIQSDNLQDLVKWGPQLLQQMKKLQGFTDVNSDQQNLGLQASLVYDRATASRMGITPQSIDNTLYQAFGQAPVSTMYTPAESILRGDGSGAAILAKPGGTQGRLRPSGHGRRSSAQCDYSVSTQYRAARREPPGPVPFRDGLLQSGARHRAE